MAKHDAISTAAFIPVPGAGSFIQPYSALVFPPAWREAIVKLEKHGKQKPEKYQEVPIRSLNAAIRALAPDLVSVATNAARRGEEPWLYTTSEYPISVLQALIVSWLQTRQPSPDAFHAVTEAFQELNLPALTWKLVLVDLLKQGLTAGGTADPEECLYRLLPDVLAARIEQLPAYEYADGEVRFYRVGANYLGGAELISWPPKKHQPKKGEEDFGHSWYYSATIAIALQTEPFSPVPRIHLSTGIRRWVHGQVHPAGRNNATVYLRTEGPWLSGGTGTSRFAAAPIRVRWGEDKDEVRASWALGGPADILSRLSIAQDFPKPADIAQDAEGWLRGRDAVAAAVAYHTAMKQNHGTGVGLMPSERRRLTQWAGTALAPHFEPLGDLRKSRHPRSQSNPKAQLKVHESVPRKSIEDAAPEELAKNAAERAKARAANERIDIENARLRRQFLARAVGGDHVLTCHLLYQTTAVRDALIAAAESSLDLEAYRASFPQDTPEGPWREGTCAWHAPDLEVRMHIREARDLVLPLGGTEAPKAGREARKAIADRRRTVRDFLRGQEDSQLALVEIEPRATFKKRTTDPKFAIRLGCADAGRVSQFINPIPAAERDPKGKKDLAKDLSFRAEASWDDGLRQLGMSFIPQHSLTLDAIPERLNQVAFWVVRRNADAQSRNRQFTPIAVLIRPDQDRVMGRMPGMQQWVPYPELLRRLTGQVRGDDLKTKVQRRAETARFVRNVLYTLRGEPTVVLTDAQNARQSWDWLQNGLLAPDKIQMGDGPVQNLALHGRHLRLIRVRDGGDRHETPQWWAPYEDDDEAGLAKGLWVPPGVEDDRRVFYATGAKGVSHKKSGVNHTKLSAHVVIKDGSPIAVTNADIPAWNPTLLEITVAGCAPGDKPVDWAMWVQQQRFPDYYREEGLKLPLVMHFAEQAIEYALPHEYAESGLLEETSDTGSAEADMDEAEDAE